MVAFFARSGLGKRSPLLSTCKIIIAFHILYAANIVSSPAVQSISEIHTINLIIKMSQFSYNQDNLPPVSSLAGPYTRSLDDPLRLPSPQLPLSQQPSQPATPIAKHVRPSCSQGIENVLEVNDSITGTPSYPEDLPSPHTRLFDLCLPTA